MAEECSDQASSYSWWWDSHNHPHQSQWLQATLSDLDKKVKMMLTLVEEDGDSFTKRAEMYYKKRPELIEMIEDLHRSYRSLAERYDQLRSESSELVAESRSLPDSFKRIQHLPIGNLMPFNKIEVLEAPTLEAEKIVGFGKSEHGEIWDELRVKVSELIQDNLHQQAELVRRNEEKRKAIKVLRARISRLMEENSSLKSCLVGNKVDLKRNQSHMSRMKEIILGKLLR
ncbi:kinase interacting (KIP1-like) family protein [Actinidia rufa]|uniref:Kinase interacting (KIP1-like) family protein n=1 Tax=Actinidia rufa TaxID=165716 RepID=A0A7J0HDG4_9ERIC|nr:kinase interacting (KIP1-like) family protein [Actinidia rufa]